jgi:hypothetical protein
MTDSTSLFYMTPQPATLNFLRQYALHVLFIPPAPSANGALDSTAAPVHNPFPFVHKLSTLDRDRIIVSTGWDSWGKTRRSTRKHGVRHGSTIFCLSRSRVGRQ